MNWRSRWQQWRAAIHPYQVALVDLLYPRQCDACRKPQMDLPEFPVAGRVCDDCYAELTRVQAPYCRQCAEPFGMEHSQEFLCANCTDRQLAFDFAFAPFESRGPVRDMIHEFKYNRQLHLKVALGNLLAEALEEPRLAARQDWLLTPVPLHPIRFRERTFNQSAELADALHTTTGLAVQPGLRRTRYTTGQARLDREGRLENLRGAIALTPRAKASRCFTGRAVLLIDDVLTTGATAHECAAVLKQQGGAAVVAALCVARG